MSNTIDQIELYADVDLADILDIRASEVRDRLKMDPGSLPVPFCFKDSGLIRWPASQIRAWIRAGEPRDWNLLPSEFVPSSIARYHNPHALLASPTNPVSDKRIAAAILDGEPAVEYPA